MRIRRNPFFLSAVALFLTTVASSGSRAQVAKPPAIAKPATTAVIQSQDTNVAGVVAELTECNRKDGVLSVKVRLHNTSTAPVNFHLIEGIGDYSKFYVTAENKKYFILTDSEKLPLAPHLDNGYPWIDVKIAPGGSYQWWAKYPAPPGSAKTLTLYTRLTPPFDDVPITGPVEAADPAPVENARILDIVGVTRDLDGVMKDLGAKVTAQEIKIALSADVLFDFDKFDLKPRATDSLVKVATVVKAYPKAPLLIEGHTDGKGTHAYNVTLSENRATSVKTWLAQNAGVAPARIATSGLGETKPVAPNTLPDGTDNPEGRQKNRRVEITLRTI